jgi:hypothetical protein
METVALPLAVSIVEQVFDTSSTPLFDALSRTLHQLLGRYCEMPSNLTGAAEQGHNGSSPCGNSS